MFLSFALSYCLQTNGKKYDKNETLYPILNAYIRKPISHLVPNLSAIQYIIVGLELFADLLQGFSIKRPSCIGLWLSYGLTYKVFGSYCPSLIKFSEFCARWYNDYRTKADLKTQASFVCFFLPQKFRWIPAKRLRKSFVISMGLPTFFERVEII